MKAEDIEKLNQIISRTDKTGNEKVELLIDFIESQLKERDEKINNLVKHKRNLEKELSKYVSKKVIR